MSWISIIFSVLCWLLFRLCVCVFDSCFVFIVVVVVFLKVSLLNGVFERLRNFFNNSHCSPTLAGIVSTLLPELSPIISPWEYALFPRVMTHVCQWCQRWGSCEAVWRESPRKCKTWTLFSHPGLKKGESLRVSTPSDRSMIVTFLETLVGGWGE